MLLPLRAWLFDEVGGSIFDGDSDSDDEDGCCR